MNAPQKFKTARIALGEIKIPDRLRELDDKRVALIVQSAGDANGIRDAIHVRKIAKGYELIDGRHRLAACEAFGATEIEASVWKCTAEQARLVEADANVLSGGLLTALDLAVSLAARKQAYEAVYPETKQGISGGLARQGHHATNLSFAHYVADVMGKTPRHVQRLISAGEALEAAEVRALQPVARFLSQQDVDHIGRIGEDEERAFIVKTLVSGKAKKVAKARKLYAAEQGTAPAPVDPVDAEFQALLKAWQRARRSARVLFLEKVSRDIREIEGGSDE